MKLFAFYKHQIFAFWLVLISFSSGYSQCCNYTLDMQDSFSDTWDGATLEVIVNGSSLGLFSVPNGSPSSTENIVVCDGQSIYDSETVFAQNLREQIKLKFDEGFSKKNIKDHLSKI